MEDFDAETDGSPVFQTFRRAERIAFGGTGLLWIEATSVVEEDARTWRSYGFMKKIWTAFSPAIRVWWAIGWHDTSEAVKEILTRCMLFLRLLIAP